MKKQEQNQASAQPKNKYRIQNWKDYNQALVQRGSIDLYIDPHAVSAWKAAPEGKPGHQKEFSDTAIQVILMIQKTFHLRLRQLEGFICSVFKMGEISLPVPDYTTISRRAGSVNLTWPVKSKQGKITAILDSTGLKVYGEGEWKVRQHGSSKRRTWKKLHLCIDPSGQIQALTLTNNDVDDAAQVKPLTKDIKKQIKIIIGDGAYDKKKVYNQFGKTVQVLIPPREDAVLGLHDTRDKNIRDILNSNRKEWKKSIGYHKRSLAENAIFRIKTIFGDKLFYRMDEKQITEAKIMGIILNKFTKLGMPKSYVVN